MSRIVEALFLMTLLAASAVSCAHGRHFSSDYDDGKRRLIVISVDGLRPDFYRGVEFEASHLKAWAAQGAAAGALQPIFPSLTYPMHTTLVTGVGSSQHGVLANTVYSPELGPTPDWYWHAGKVRAPTLWQRAHEAGKTVAIARWPASVGAEVDWMVPEIFGAPGFDFARDWRLIRENTRPELMRELLEGAPITAEAGYRSLEELDRFTAHALIELIENHHPELLLAHFVNVDLVQHLTGRGSPQTHRALAEVDRLLASVIEHVNLARTTVVIVGDHGFLDFRKLVNPNALFREQGWLAPERIAIAHAEGGQAAIYARNSADGPRVLKLLQAHAAGRYKLISRAELDRLAAYPGALCALEALTDVAFGASLTDPFEVVNPVTKGAHGHLPGHPEIQAGLLAFGAGVTPGRDLGQLRAIDVAPTLADALGLRTQLGEGKSFGLVSPKPGAP